MSVHFKFKTARDFDTIAFQGPYISLGELKKAILAKKRLSRSNDMDLEVMNAQTNESMLLISIYLVGLRMTDVDQNL
jgi:E3 ubiquitin-protein ligase RBBP6